MNRRDFMAHVAWTGLGIVWAMGADGLLKPARAAEATDRLTLVQISDTHIGYHQAANPEVEATVGRAITAINAMPRRPAFIVHTGDVSHLSKPAEFDTARQLLGQLKAPVFAVPGEHDVIGDHGRAFRAAFGRDTTGAGWYTWEQAGVHFFALVNVLQFGEKGVGALGDDQIAWLADVLRPLPSDTPIVVLAHIPLFPLYPAWGWATSDAPKALALLQRFERVTVLNGHVHQVVHHMDGRIHFATAASLAFPLPPPGQGAHPAPLVLPPDARLAALGYRQVTLDRAGVGIEAYGLK